MDRRKLKSKSSLHKLDSSEATGHSTKRKRSISPVEARSDDDLFPTSPQLTKRVCSRRREESSSLTGRPDRLKEYLEKCGIKLNPRCPPSMDLDRQLVERTMKELLDANEYKVEEIVAAFDEYIKEPNNVGNILLPMDSDLDEIRSKISLTRLLLRIPKLQSKIRQSFLYKLSECTILAQSSDQVPWLDLLLTELSFLELTVDPDAFSITLDDVLIAGPSWFQRELIKYLPDILTDSQHPAVMETLDKLMSNNLDLTGSVLDCIGQFNLGKESIAEYEDKVLTLLKTNRTLQSIPAMILFVLGDSPTYESSKKLLLILRGIEMRAFFGDDVDQCVTMQKKIINALNATLRFKEVAKAMSDVVRTTSHEPSPVDVIYILLIYLHKSGQRKSMESVIKVHVKSGFYRTSLLKTFYKDYKEVGKDLQAAAIPLAGNLLTIENKVYVDFGIDWLRCQFNSQKDVSYKQREILESTLILMGKNNATANNVLLFLREIAVNDEDSNLQSHTNLLRLLLEKMHQLDLEQVGILNDLLYSLCIEDGVGGNQLYDELMIVQQKQLHAAKSLTKSRGVMATAMAIKHLAVSDTSDLALNLFDKVLTTVKSCPRSQALFYDELGKIVIESTNVNEKFVDHVKQRLLKDFHEIYLEGWEKYKDGEMVPRYGLDPDDDGRTPALNFRDGKYGAVLPIALKLLKICSKEENSPEVDALLGVPVLMPRDFDMPDSTGLDRMMCCVNWFRESISGFVAQKDSSLKKKVLQRLNDLIELQGELSRSLSFVETNYQPSPCYFHRVTPPSMTKVDKKVGKKTKKKEINETSDWEMGSSLGLKNPAYFRRMNTKVVHLLENDQSITRVCFLVREVLGMFDNEPGDDLVRDLIDLLPRIMGKLESIVDELREEDEAENREALRLLLELFNAVFKWEGFRSAAHRGLLQDGLKIVGKIQTNVRSNRELVSESYKYFDSIADVATRLTIAHSLVNVCQTLMQHSQTFSQRNTEKQAHLSYGFLCLAWSDEPHSGPSWTTPLNGLLNNWIENEASPLTTVTEILEWLPDEISKLEKSNDNLKRIPTINRRTLNLLLKRLFQGMISGLKISLSAAKTDPQRIDVWKKIGNNVKTIVQICKLLAVKPNIVLFSRYVPVLLKSFLTIGMPVLECNLKYQTEDVTGLLKTLQSATRYLHYICSHFTVKKDVTLLKLIPTAKSILEKFIYRVKGMLAMNDVSPAFWMGNLLNKNLEGVEIESQASNEGTSTTDVDSNSNLDNESEVLDEEDNLSVTSEED